MKTDCPRTIAELREYVETLPEDVQRDFIRELNRRDDRTLPLPKRRRRRQSKKQTNEKTNAEKKKQTSD